MIDGVLSKLEGIKRAIWEKRPVLSEIMKKHGGKTLYGYAQDFLDVNKSSVLDARKPELVATAKRLITDRLGSDVALGVSKQLLKYPLVSTTDHHGPIDHPFFVNANIISAIPYAAKADSDLKYLVVFSFASVSVNNASAFPRGIIFHGDTRGSRSLIRLPVLPDKLKMGVVYGTRAFTRDDLNKAEVELSKREKTGEIEFKRAECVRTIMEEFLGTKKILDAPDLASQITEINFGLWPRLFNQGGLPDSVQDSQLFLQSQKTLPDLIYLEIETLVRELFISHHISNPDSPIYKIIFVQKYQAMALKYFNNLPGAFSLEKEWGTFFFWAVDEKLHRVRLVLNGAKLHSRKDKYNFELSPETIGRALREKKIFPSMLLCYLMVALYYGMKCLGGFSQVHDLTVIKEAWTNLLREMVDEDEAEAVVPVQTKELGGDGLVLAYLKTASGGLVPATGIDLILEPANMKYETYGELSKKVTLLEMMNPMFPEIYKVLYAFPDRNPEFSDVTPEDIMVATGLQSKLGAGHRP